MITCPSCGTENDPQTRTCAQCGAPLPVETLPDEVPAAEPAVSEPPFIPSPAPTPAAQPVGPTPAPGLPPYPQPYYAPRPPKDRGVALVLEILPGLFGLLGFGWIYSGNASVGILWLVGVLLWDFCAIIINLLSAGFGCLCTVPVNLVLVAVSASLLNTYTRQHPELFG